MNEEQEIKLLLPNQEYTTGWISFCELDEADYSVKLRYGNEEIQERGSSVFSAFNCIRNNLDKDGIVADCYGCAVNAYPCRMSLNGGGTQLYLLQEGIESDLDDLVFIFDTKPELTLGSVEEQQAFYNRWCDSQKVINSPLTENREASDHLEAGPLNLKLNDFLTACGLRLDPLEFKIHLSKAFGEHDPLEEYFKGTFKDYQEVQNLKNFPGR